MHDLGGGPLHVEHNGIDSAHEVVVRRVGRNRDRQGRCALSGLAESLLLDAAHIVSDKDELLGQPLVRNGMPLSRIHHAAFDAHLIGIDPDYQVHISDRLLHQIDGPMLEALKGLRGSTIHLPDRMQDRPDRDRLALRFERFRAAS